MLLAVPTLAGFLDRLSWVFEPVASAARLVACAGSCSASA
jgi:hypothetical protein